MKCSNPHCKNGFIEVSAIHLGHGAWIKRLEPCPDCIGGIASCCDAAGKPATRARTGGERMIAPGPILQEQICRLRDEVESEREACRKLERALRRKDSAMTVLFERLRAAGVDCSDLIP
jgi:hypothetical protein